MDPPSNAGSATGTLPIPMRFVWPYGGREVYLCGSFTRWSEFLRMSPVEGCPTVFQVIHSLPPGYHQYKFFVDREWRHDEHQPYVSGDFGVVNTVFLATNPTALPVSTPQVASSSSMDVENEAIQRMVQSTDGTLAGILPRITDTYIQTSCQHISAFLSMHTAYELLPESGKVVAVDVDLPVKQAFHILYEQGIPIAPLWDFSKGHFIGILSPLDFILILRELKNRGSNLTEEELETHTISSWKEGKLYLNRQHNGQGTMFPRRFIHAGPFDNLKDIATKLLQNEISTVPIVHSKSEDGSFQQLLYLASLSGILNCICRYFRHCSSSLPILQLPISAVPVGTWVPKIGEPNRRPLAMLRPNASLMSALNLLVQAQISSIPIVDDNDSLVDVYCRSDITSLAKDRAYTHINFDEVTIQQALQLGQDSYHSYNLRSLRCQMCLRSDSLHKVIEQLANPGVRRLVVVEAGSKRVEGIVSLSDIFKFFLGLA